MYCYHCEGDISRGALVLFEAKHFCSTSCEKACLREFFSDDLRKKIIHLKIFSEELSENLEKTRSQYKELEAEVEVYDKVLRTRLPETDFLSRFKNSLSKSADQVTFLQMKKRSIGLQMKTIQFLLDRNMKMYTLFKTKLYSEWDTLLSMSPDDGFAVQEADDMSGFYNFFKKIEFAFE
jgi:hypothetical protein